MAVKDRKETVSRQLRDFRDVGMGILAREKETKRDEVRWSCIE